MLYLVRLPIFDYETKKLTCLYKIGYSKNVNKRLSQYGGGNPNATLLCCRDGTMEDERALHKYLSDFEKYENTYEYYYENDKLIKIFVELPLGFSSESYRYSDKEKENYIMCLIEYLNHSNLNISPSIILNVCYGLKFKITYFSSELISYYLSESLGIDLDYTHKLLERLENKNQISVDVDNEDYKNAEKEVDAFLEGEFNTQGLFDKRMKNYCDFCESHLDNVLVISILKQRLKYDPISIYYEFYGTVGCRTRSFQEISLRRGMLDKFNEPALKDVIHSSFELGEKYTMKATKELLKKIYQDLGITKSPKAIDIEKYYTVVKNKVLVDGKTMDAYRLLEKIDV